MTKLIEFLGSLVASAFGLYVLYEMVKVFGATTSFGVTFNVIFIAAIIVVVVALWTQLKEIKW